ncbi:hypothetical protein HBI60_259090 [Parastagonospora nodorum]|nr:hypothetical protein HBI60_259090 [Parastagonospora nodorum]
MAHEIIHCVGRALGSAERREHHNTARYSRPMPKISCDAVEKRPCIMGTGTFRFEQRLRRVNYPLQLHDHRDGLTRSRHKRGVGEKIDNYDEKIRDCNMRVDGIAMATQWFQGETAVEIAFTTSQDSRIMRSISLVTMVFLPGTFFATVFSMSFFDWNDEDGKASVSKHLWIYVVVTVMFTAITIGIWYFFVLFRRSRPVDNNEAEMRWD